MKLLIFESNLLWSSRLLKTLRGLGHEAVVRTVLPTESEGAQAAIVNLGEGPVPAGELIARLKSLGVVTIGHAGHKEKELHELGRAAGCDILATNSELTFKLEKLLDQVEVPGLPEA